jgi:hypothetical protein
MARKLVCDNISCDNEESIDEYGDIADEETPSWYVVTRSERYYWKEPEDEDTEENERILVNEPVSYEFCSVNCLVNTMSLFKDG